MDFVNCSYVKKIDEKKRQQIDDQIKDLTALRDVLDSLVRGCEKNPSTEHCSLIDTLSKKTSSNIET